MEFLINCGLFAPIRACRDGKRCRGMQGLGGGRAPSARARAGRERRGAFNGSRKDLFWVPLEPFLGDPKSLNEPPRQWRALQPPINGPST